MKERFCRHCGKLFTPGNNKGIYHSGNCRSAARRVRVKQARILAELKLTNGQRLLRLHQLSPSATETVKQLALESGAKAASIALDAIFQVVA